MKEKVKCKKCKLLIDEDSKFCPYCGYDQSLDDSNENSTINKNESISIPKSQILTFHRKDGAFSLSNFHNILLLLINVIGMNLLVLIFTGIFNATGLIDNIGIEKANSILTLTVYPILLIGLLLSLWEAFLPIVKTFTKWKNLLYGLGFGAALIGISMLYNLLISSFGITSNDNQAQIEKGVIDFPIACIIVLGLIGPLCEELTYRIGLYGWLRKKNFWIALFISSIIFGLIHFNFAVNSKEALIIELTNLPSYIISGIILGLAYETGGIASSFTAHALNNVLAVILIIVQ